MLAVQGRSRINTARNQKVGRKLRCEWVTIRIPTRRTPSSARTPCTSRDATRAPRSSGAWRGARSRTAASTWSPAEAGTRTAVRSGATRRRGLKHGVLRLLYESTNKGNLDQPDCLTVSPRGGVVVCEDGDGEARGGGTNRIRVFTPEGQDRGIRPERHAARSSRAGRGDRGAASGAGSTYSPDGKWLFVSLQIPGKTFGITGPWGARLALTGSRPPHLADTFAIPKKQGPRSHGCGRLVVVEAAACESCSRDARISRAGARAGCLPELSYIGVMRHARWRRPERVHDGPLRLARLRAGLDLRQASETLGNPMKAMTQDRYGSAGVLAVDGIAMPVVGDDEVWYRVQAASVGPDVWHLMTGEPYFVRLMGFGLRRPKTRVVGRDVAGSVEAVGRNLAGSRREMKYSAPAGARLPSSPAPQPAAEASRGWRGRSGAQAGEPHLRAGGGRSDLRTDCPPGFARRGRDSSWAVGVDHRCFRRRRHVSLSSSRRYSMHVTGVYSTYEGGRGPLDRRRPRDRLLTPTSPIRGTVMT